MTALPFFHSLRSLRLCARHKNPGIRTSTTVFVTRISVFVTKSDDGESKVGHGESKVGHGESKVGHWGVEGSTRCHQVFDAPSQ